MLHTIPISRFSEFYAKHFVGCIIIQLPLSVNASGEFCMQFGYSCISGCSGLNSFSIHSIGLYKIAHIQLLYVLYFFHLNKVGFFPILKAIYFPSIVCISRNPQRGDAGTLRSLPQRGGRDPHQSTGTEEGHHWLDLLRLRPITEQQDHLPVQVRASEFRACNS